MIKKNKSHFLASMLVVLALLLLLQQLALELVYLFLLVLHVLVETAHGAVHYHHLACLGVEV